jgi:MoxR-like ATPase
MKLHINYPDFNVLKQIVITNERTPDPDPDPASEPPSGAPLDIDNFRLLEQEVIVLDDIRNFITRLVVSTHPQHTDITAVKQYVQYGASPRAAIYLLRAAKWHALLDNRVNVSFDDINTLAFDILNHRIILNFEGESEYVDTRSLVSGIIQKLEKQFRIRS